MKWVKVDDYYYNADHIVEFQWSMGRLYIWDDAPITANVIENVCTFDDPNGKKYDSLCSQLELNSLRPKEAFDASDKN